MERKITFNGSADVFRWLDTFINLERGQSDKSFRLDRMEHLAKFAGRPEHFAPAIHVAGSKGKGSVTTMIASILDTWGLKTARYVSPHVTDYRERVSLARQPFPEAIYAEAGEELRSVLELIGAEPEGKLPGGEEPTFFELMTLLLFLCARRAKCDAAVLETGMGGRLDATNIVDPLISVITPIELEHTEYLGSSIAAIAGEKAGIIKKARPVLVSEQPDEALAVFRATAAERSSPLRYLPEEVDIQDIDIDREGTSGVFFFSDTTLFPRPLRVRLPLVGAIQAKNAAMATLAAKLAFPNIDDQAILAGLERTVLPARFERVSDAPSVVVDGAHTARSVAYAAESFTSLYGTKGILLFGCAIGKDVAAMARILAPGFSRVFVTAPGTFKKSDPPTARRAFADNGVRTDLIEETEEAIETAFRAAKESGLPILATGSFYLAAAVRNHFITSPDAKK